MRFRWQERVFVSWAGLRGAVPIVLATFALSAKVAESTTIFNAVFFVVLVSALVQGMTVEPLADRLGLTTERRPRLPAADRGRLRRAASERRSWSTRSIAGDAVVGRHVRDTALPRDAIVMLIVRDGTGIPPRGSTVVEAGDRLYIMVSAGSRRQIDDVLDRWRDGPLPQPA